MSTGSQEHHRQRGNLLLWLSLFTIAAIAMRSLWLTWQPLWWDEGYSIYFATESLARMIWLTAHDIHPPLYYVLLHGWSQLAGSVSPAVARSLSIVIGALSVPLTGWLGLSFFPTRPRVALLAAFLMLINPMQLYYSQEARMYGLALTLTLLATGFFWLSVRRLATRQPATVPLIGYAISATLALYALYYCAFLLLAHALWAGWTLRQRWPALRALLVTWLAIGLAFLPWLIYATPKLVGYVAQKVASDQDQPLNAVDYVGRHLVAFTAGHIQPSQPFLEIVGVAGVAGLALLGIFAIRKFILDRRSGFTDANSHEAINPVGALWCFLLTPAILAFLFNLRWPFFPDGGERLLLFVLPYLILLVAFGVTATGMGGLAALTLLVVGSLAGVATFFTTPRFVEDDYRPLIRQVAQQGADSDTLLAIFPWLIGYWRAYTPPDLTGPQPLLLGDSAVEYGPEVEVAINAALTNGRLWFPEPLSFGSSLPQQIESYLHENSIPLENRWYSDATRLTAWARASAPELHPIKADFGKVLLAAGGATSSPVASANETIVATLAWETQAPTSTLAVTLRLTDQQGEQVWASRDYAPLGSLASQMGERITETVGLNAPVGLAPGRYTLGAGVSENGAPLVARMDDQEGLLFAPLGQVEIVQPQTRQHTTRLPMPTARAAPPLLDGIAWLGAAAPATPILAGTELPLTLFFQNQRSTPPERSLYISVVDQNGAGVAGWQGWPLPTYPTSTWPEGALVQAPVRFFLPPTTPSGRYRVIGGWVDEGAGVKSIPVSLAEVTIEQRAHEFTPLMAPIDLNPAPLLGTHAVLTGYDLEPASEAITLTLYWDIQQTLLPPHHIFVHVDDASGATVAQADGPPVTAAGSAPTGTWLAGERLATVHRLARPLGDETVLRVGLYEPQTGVRLPVTIDGIVQGDAVTLVGK